ncbi:MAG: RDD family protein [Pseudomonadota bacterium]|nr:RDD family protein [Pseudomonadota bacterium]
MQVSSAPIWKRLLALIYDGLVVTALILISGLVSSVIARGEAPAWLTQMLIVLSVGGYFWLSWSRGGQTAGMRAWRLRLVKLDGEAITNDVAFKRLAWCVITLAPTGVMLFTGWLSPIGQTVYDRLSNTRVVAGPKPRKSTQ